MRRDEQNRLICNMYEVFRWAEVHSGLSGDSHLFRSASSGLWKLEMCCPLVDIFFLLRVKPGWVRKQMHPSGNKQTLVFAKPFRFERQQAILKEELAKITQREKELADEKTKASIQERQHARQESEKTKQLVWKNRIWNFDCRKHIFDNLMLVKEIFSVVCWAFSSSFSEALGSGLSQSTCERHLVFCSFTTETRLFFIECSFCLLIQNHKAHFLTLIWLCSIHYVIQL